MPCVCAKCGREDAIARGEAGSGDGRERRRKWACSCRVCSAGGAEVRQCLLTRPGDPPLSYLPFPGSLA